MPNLLSSLKIVIDNFDDLRANNWKLHSEVVKSKVGMDPIPQALLNDDNDAFASKELTEALKEIVQGVSTEETAVLEEYLEVKGAKEQLAFIGSHKEIAWGDMEVSKNGTYSKTVVKKYLLQTEAREQLILYFTLLEEI